MDASEQSFWKWAGKVQEEVRRSGHAPDFNLEQFKDFQFIEQQYFDELTPWQAARNVLNMYNWG